MIHVATTHWRDDSWIDIQLAYLERHLPKPYRVYSISTAAERDYSDRYFYWVDLPIRDHATKLNLSYDLVALAADSDDDPILFLDGDCFPIADVSRLIEEDLPRHEIVAMQRLETEDPHPHPAFCLSTVGFWRELPGDWRKGGHHWIGAGGREVSDVGVRVLKAVEEKKVDWRPLLRSNKRDPHPLYFGVYDDLVYHHGAGFRPSRGGRKVMSDSGLYAAQESLRHRFLRSLPRSKWTSRLRRRYDPTREIEDRLRQDVQDLSVEWYERIKRDPEFYRELI
jgi:hypothetical protein